MNQTVTSRWSLSTTAQTGPNRSSTRAASGTSTSPSTRQSVHGGVEKLHDHRDRPATGWTVKNRRMMRRDERKNE